jgi:hypothetical protein
MVWDHFTGRARPSEDPQAIDTGDELRAQAARLLAAVPGSSWYEHPGNPADRALFVLCRLRRAAASEKRSSEGGDVAVREVLEAANPEAVLWLASRVISYMDEQGFPETVEPWLGRD